MENNNQRTRETLRPFVCEGTPDSIFSRYASLPERAAQSDFGPFDSHVVVIDTETTGISFAHDELTQIAAARVSGGKIVDWYVTFVNPGKPISDEIAQLTGITDDDVANAPSPNEALEGLVAFAGDAYMVAHNAEFDRTFTTKHPGGYPLLENVWIDSLDLSRIVLPRMKSHRLIDLVRAFDAPLSTHRADADVAATCAMLRILLAGIEIMPLSLVRAIAGLAPREQWPTSVVFEYFAQRANDEKGKGFPSLSDADERFSLRALRRARVNAQAKPKKRDAEDKAADPQEGLEFPSIEEVRAAFDSDGLVGALYENYERRPEQTEMAEAVREAFSRSENAVIEAGTGVGKSMAYLVPAVLTAKKNGVAVGVATKTNALLDQLVNHELPLLATALPDLAYAPLKGFTHYLCLRRVEHVLEDGAQMKVVAGKEVCQAPSIAAVLSFVEQTEYSDIDSLKIDYRSLPRRSITTTSRDCLRRKCPFFGASCYVHGARQRAEAADIVVTNHSLLFCDLMADGGLLPPIRYWVIDEAHGTEEEARKAFSIALAAEDIMRLARAFESDEASRNMIVRAERRAVSHGSENGETLLYALTGKARAAGKDFAASSAAFCARIKDLLYFDANKRSKGYETVDLWLNDDIRHSDRFQSVAESGKQFSDAAEKLVKACQELVGLLEEYDNVAEVQREIASAAMTLKDMVAAAAIIFGPQDESYAYAATLSKKSDDRPRDELQALLVNVGSALDDRLFARSHSVVFTSATITVDGSFEAFSNALQLNASSTSRARMVRLDSSYDFDRCMTIYVAQDMPEPNAPSYIDKLSRLLTAVHIAQNGSLLTLFTNRREMEKCYDAVQPELKVRGLRLVCQKWGVSAKGLRDDFLADEHLSLFALKSFWEGFDAPGATLKGVVIPKLPFARPTDPLSCERASRDDAAWRHYVLPAAVIDMKQAAGRLIRSSDDSGVLVLADSRLVTKGYGKAFLNSLPSKTIKILPCSAIVRDIAKGRE